MSLKQPTNLRVRDPYIRALFEREARYTGDSAQQAEQQAARALHVAGELREVVA